MRHELGPNFSLHFFHEKLDLTYKEVLNRYMEINFNMVTRYS